MIEAPGPAAPASQPHATWNPSSPLQVTSILMDFWSEPAAFCACKSSAWIPASERDGIQPIAPVAESIERPSGAPEAVQLIGLSPIAAGWEPGGGYGVPHAAWAGGSATISGGTEPSLAIAVAVTRSEQVSPASSVTRNSPG